MTRQELVLRCREALTWLRARITRRRVLVVSLSVFGLGFVGITTEAVFRARISPPEMRIPSALYSRPVPWGGQDTPRVPVPISTVDGRALEQRVAVRLVELPEHLVGAVLAVEDQRFRSHSGLD